MNQGANLHFPAPVWEERAQIGPMNHANLESQVTSLLRIAGGERSK